MFNYAKIPKNAQTTQIAIIANIITSGLTFLFNKTYTNPVNNNGNNPGIIPSIID